MHSASRVAVYARCPRRYYWRYVVKVPQRRTSAQALGINLHAALEALEQAAPGDGDGERAALASLAATWTSEGFASPEEEQACRLEAAQRLIRYASAREARRDRGTPLMLEKRLEGRLGELRIRGIVDRVDKLPDGSLALLDYKTGARDAAEVTDATLQQLAIYRSLVTQATGLVPAQVVVVRPGGSDTSLDLDEEAWAARLTVAHEAMVRLSRDEDFEPVVTPSCGSCDYASRCVPHQRARLAAGEVRP